MATIKIAQPEEVTPEVLLSKITELTERQKSPRPISMDTLQLVFRVNKAELDMLIDELVSAGKIIICPQTIYTKQSLKKEAVRLL